MKPGRLYQGRPCTHHGTIWRIQLVGAQVCEPQLGDWECTRCGERWDEDPGLLPRAGHRTRRLAELMGSR